MAVALTLAQDTFEATTFLKSRTIDLGLPCGTPEI